MDRKITFLHTADIHLGCELKTSGPRASERRAEILLCLKNIFSLCNIHDVQIMLISGDLFENNSVSEDIVDSFLDYVKSAPKTRVFYAAGNHDPLTADSPLLDHSLPDNLYILGTKDECIPLDDIGVKVFGRSFSGASMKGSNTFSIPSENDGFLKLMVIHGDFGTDISGPYNTITREFIETSGMDYIALGHVHKYSGVNKIGNTYFAYPGCPEPHGFDETGNKGVIIGSFCDNVLSHEFVHTSIRTYRDEKIDISEAVTSDGAAKIIVGSLKERFGEMFNKNLYKLTLIGRLPEGVKIKISQIERMLSEQLYFAKIKDRTEVEIDLDILKNENTLKGKFVKIMLKKQENTNDESERNKLRCAMFLGLKAFSSEVKYNED